MQKHTRKSPFPLFVDIYKRNSETGQKEPVTLEIQGTSYISQHTGIPIRTIKWKAKKGLIAGVQRIGADRNERVLYGWKLSDADAYIEKMNTLREQLFNASNDEFYDNDAINTNNTSDSEDI